MEAMPASPAWPSYFLLEGALDAEALEELLVAPPPGLHLHLELEENRMA
jgi:hypothetical protein